MRMPDTLHVLKVFVGRDGAGGNPLGVFLDAGGCPASRRQEIAAELGYSETVFVTDAARGELHIHTPTVEMPFAGHPLVGTAWLLARIDAPLTVLRPPAGEVRTWATDDQRWVSARPEWAPPFEMRQLSSPAEVEAHPGAGPREHLQIWAWDDRDAGTVRVRVFPTALGIAEDEATGAAAVRLGAMLATPLTIHQGKASEIAVRPGTDGTVAIGGTVALVETRPY